MHSARPPSIRTTAPLRQRPRSSAPRTSHPLPASLSEPVSSVLFPRFSSGSLITPRFPAWSAGPTKAKVEAEKELKELHSNVFTIAHQPLRARPLKPRSASPDDFHSLGLRLVRSPSGQRKIEEFYPNDEKQTITTESEVSDSGPADGGVDPSSVLDLGASLLPAGHHRAVSIVSVEQLALPQVFHHSIVHSSIPINDSASDELWLDQRRLDALMVRTAEETEQDIKLQELMEKAKEMEKKLIESQHRALEGPSVRKSAGDSRPPVSPMPLSAIPFLASPSPPASQRSAHRSSLSISYSPTPRLSHNRSHSAEQFTAHFPVDFTLSLPLKLDLPPKPNEQTLKNASINSSHWGSASARIRSNKLKLAMHSAGAESTAASDDPRADSPDRNSHRRNRSQFGLDLKLIEARQRVERLNEAAQTVLKRKPSMGRRHRRSDSVDSSVGLSGPGTASEDEIVTREAAAQLYRSLPSRPQTARGHAFAGYIHSRLLPSEQRVLESTAVEAPQIPRLNVFPRWVWKREDFQRSYQMDLTAQALAILHLKPEDRSPLHIDKLVQWVKKSANKREKDNESITPRNQGNDVNRLAYLASLPEPVLIAVLRVIQLHRVSAGSFIYREGEVAECFYLLHSGYAFLRVKLNRQFKRGSGDSDQPQRSGEEADRIKKYHHRRRSSVWINHSAGTNSESRQGGPSIGDIIRELPVNALAEAVESAQAHANSHVSGAANRSGNAALNSLAAALSETLIRSRKQTKRGLLSHAIVPTSPRSGDQGQFSYEESILMASATFGHSIEGDISLGTALSEAELDRKRARFHWKLLRIAVFRSRSESQNRERQEKFQASIERFDRLNLASGIGVQETRKPERRSETVVALSDCTLLSINYEAFSSIKSQYELTQGKFLIEFLGKLPLFKSWDLYKLQQLQSVLLLRTVKRGDYLWHQNESTSQRNELCFVLSGALTASREIFVVQSKRWPLSPKRWQQEEISSLVECKFSSVGQGECIGEEVCEQLNDPTWGDKTDFSVRCKSPHARILVLKRKFFRFLTAKVQSALIESAERRRALAQSSILTLLKRKYPQSHAVKPFERCDWVQARRVGKPELTHYAGSGTIDVHFEREFLDLSPDTIYVAFDPPSLQEIAQRQKQKKEGKHMSNRQAKAAPVKAGEEAPKSLLSPTMQPYLPESHGPTASTAQTLAVPPPLSPTGDPRSPSHRRSSFVASINQFRRASRVYTTTYGSAPMHSALSAHMPQEAISHSETQTTMLI